MNENSLEESIMLTALLLISRESCRTEKCQWDVPCAACFASTICEQVMSSPRFARWHKRYKITAKRRRKIKKTVSVDAVKTKGLRS